MFILAICCIPGIASSRAADQFVDDTISLFQAGQNGYASYRIPSIITTTRGTLLAFCEARRKPGDAGDIDLVFRRSADNGKTWGEQKIIWDDGANTCGNPCPVVDQETGTIWLLMTHNPGDALESDIVTYKVRDSRSVWVCKSEDDGRSWSKPKEITQTTKKSGWGWYATGPGIGIQIKYGPHRDRLVIPCDHSYADSAGHLRGGKFEYGSHIIYSDDHGETWNLGGVVKPKVNECQIAELADGNGTLLLDMRSYRGKQSRAQSISYDGGISWTAPEDAPALVEPVCQASILRYLWPDDGHKSCLLFLNPASTTKRHNMTIRGSLDEGKSWTFIKTLYPGPAAYSCMTALPDGTVGCLYEAGIKSPYDKIIFQKVDPKNIFNNNLR